MTVVCGDVIGVTKVERIVKLLSVFPVTLQEHVQSFVSPSELLRDFLTENDRQCICRVANRPLFILNKLSKEIRTIPDCSSFASAGRMALQKHIEDLTTTICACERIVQTPVPLTYARHTSRFLSLFCLSTPIALVGELHAYIIPFVSFVAWSLFGIQEIGMMIEEPFQRALKLEVFANTIRRDLSDLLHVSGVSSNPIEITSSYLKYQVPINRKASSSSSNTVTQLNLDVNQQQQQQQERLQQVPLDVSKLKESNFSTDESTSTLLSI